MEELTKQGAAVRAAREHKHLTQEQLAEKLNVSKQAVYNWEKGKNHVDQSIAGDLEKELGIKLLIDSPRRKEVGTNMKALNQVGTLDELLMIVNHLVEEIEVDHVYEITVRKMLKQLLCEVLGYEVYYCDHILNEFSEVELDWDIIASDLRDVVNKREKYPMKQDYECPPFFQRDLLSQKIEFMAFMIGFGLFEDFDETGYRNGYKQQIGRLGKDCGYDLLNLVSAEHSDIMISFKSAVQDLSDKLGYSSGL